MAAAFRHWNEYKSFQACFPRSCIKVVQKCFAIYVFPNKPRHLKGCSKKFAIYMRPLKAHEIQCDPSFKSLRSKSPNLGLVHVVLISPSERHIKRAANSPPKQRKSCSPWCMHDQSSMNGGAESSLYLLLLESCVYLLLSYPFACTKHLILW